MFVRFTNAAEVNLADCDLREGFRGDFKRRGRVPAASFSVGFQAAVKVIYVADLCEFFARCWQGLRAFEKTPTLYGFIACERAKIVSAGDHLSKGAGGGVAGRGIVVVAPAGDGSIGAYGARIGLSGGNLSKSAGGDVVELAIDVAAPASDGSIGAQCAAMRLRRADLCECAGRRDTEIRSPAAYGLVFGECTDVDVADLDLGENEEAADGVIAGTVAFGAALPAVIEVGF